MAKGRAGWTDEVKAAADAKAAESVAAAQERRRLSTIEFPGKDQTGRKCIHRLFWLDEDNWCVETDEDTDSRKYYPTIEYAAKEVLNRQIGEQCKGDLRKLILAADNAGRVIAQAVLDSSRQAERPI